MNDPVFADEAFGPLVETEWLADELGAADLRVLDCSMMLDPLPDGSGLRAGSGQPAWAAGHIPGSGFIDLVGEISDPDSGLRCTLPSTERFAAALGRLGVGEGTRVVLYCRDHNVRAARVWWMLRAFGFDRAAVLNGGWVKWTLEGRPVSTEPCRYPPTDFVARPWAGLFVDKGAVRSALDTPGVRIVNALSVEQHQGTGGVHYGRPGRISGSVCVPARSLTDPVSQAYLPLDELKTRFEAAGVLGAGGVITYCGAGLAASSDALVLHLLGLPDVAVYDGSLEEWAADPACPMMTGEAGNG